MLTIILIFALVGAALVAAAAQRRWSGLRRLAGGLLISYFTIVLMLVAGEAYFRCCFAESENVITLATQNWLDRYWQVNSLGFRDREWSAGDWAGRTTVLITGDSFTAGWGTQDPADRYTDVLAARLGDDYAVINLGIYGTATPEQLELVRDYPLKNPDVIILQYFLNDINYAGLRLGLLPDPPLWPDWARESYLGNFFYNRILVGLNPDLLPDYWQWSYDAYDNAGIWSVHEQEIMEFIDYVESVDARLIVVIFPNMLDPFRSVPYVDRVAQVFQARGHEDILRLFDAAESWPLEERVVSRRDAHPSVAFHHYVGQTLYEQFFADD